MFGTDEEIKLAKKKYKLYIEFMLTQQQWSGLTKSEVDNWLYNFRESKLEEELLAYKLLSNIIYFSEKDVQNALKEGVESMLFHKSLLKAQLDSAFQFSQHALKNILLREKNKACFSPLLDNDSPHESGNLMLRYLVQQNIIRSEQSIFLSGLDSAIDQNGYSHVIIVDDCVGSGNQLRDFWRDTKIQIGNKRYSLIEYCDIKKIDISYLVLFGYDQSIEELRKEIPELNICCVRTLTDDQRVFSDNLYIWENIEEQKEAKIYFTKLANEYDYELLGYHGLDFAFIMHQTIPDWSLPVLWKNRPEWHCLMRRKNSDE